MKLLQIFALLFIVTGCSTLSRVSEPLSDALKAVDAKGKAKEVTISVFALKNYTDTPQAGMRAANIIEGILLAKGYTVTSHVSEKSYNLDKALEIAKDDGSKYLLRGGVSEWRYKTGIDGEPAVSIQTTILKAKKAKVVWSATGSDSDWGNSSIGTTAHDLLELMLATD